jgi:hypothetical protein
MRIPKCPLLLFPLPGNNDWLVLAFGILAEQELYPLMTSPLVWRDERRNEFYDLVFSRIIRDQRFRDRDDFPRWCQARTTERDPTIGNDTLLNFLHVCRIQLTEDIVLDLIILFHFIIFSNPRVVLLKEQRRGGGPRRCRIYFKLLSYLA